MGGTGADADKANPAASPTTFAGSRAALNTAATPTWAGIMSETSPAVDPAYEKLSASPLAVNPTVAPTAAPTTAPSGFNSTPYATAELPHIGLPAAPAVTPEAEAAKEFAAPTSFANPWDAGIGAQQLLQGKYGDWDRNWASDPQKAQMWLQAFADSGGDYRKVDKYYNPINLPAGQKVYWPGDPARPK